VPLTLSEMSGAGTSEDDLNSAVAHDTTTFTCPICAFEGDCHSAIQQHCVVVHYAQWQGEGLPLRDIPLEELACWTDTVNSYLENSSSVKPAASDCSSSTLSWWASADGSADIANQSPINHQLSSSAVEHVQNSGQVQLGFTTYDTLTPERQGPVACSPVQQTLTYLTAEAPLPFELPVVQPEQYVMMALSTELLPCLPETLPGLLGLPSGELPFHGPPPGEFPLRLLPPKQFLSQDPPPDRLASLDPTPGEFYGPRAETCSFRGPPPQLFPVRGPPPGEIPLQGPPPEDLYVQLLSVLK